MPSPDPIPVAVVGAGRMGRHHARLYAQLPQASLVAVVDSDAERAAALADAYGCEALDNVGTLLDRGLGLRAVSITAPTAAHETLAEPLLARGIGCLIEKPLAPSADTARRIAKVADDHGALVQVGHTERFNPALRAIGSLSITPRFIEVDRVSPMRFRSIDVGVVFDVMIHDLDIALMLTRSPLVEIRGAGAAVLGDHEDIANARLAFQDGCVANLTASRLAIKTERKMRIFSETAYVSLDFASRSGLLISQKDNTNALAYVREQLRAGADLSDLDYTELVNIQRLDISGEEPLRAQLENFLGALAGRTRPAADARAGFAAVDVSERVVDAIRAHRWEGVDPTRPVG